MSFLAIANNIILSFFISQLIIPPVLYDFTIDNYKLFDDRDINIYCAFQKTTDEKFKAPFDEIFFFYQ